MTGFHAPDEVIDGLRDVNYLADAKTGLTVFLADQLDKPVLLEGRLAWARRSSLDRWPA